MKDLKETVVLFNGVEIGFLLQPFCLCLSTGKYNTLVEKSEGAAGSEGHSAVYGITNWDQVNSTLAMFVVWNRGESITGWVGE